MESPAPIDHDERITAWRRRAPFVLLPLLLTHPARAQDATESEWFRVTRAPGTESCPDAQRLQSAVSALLDHSPGKPSAPLQIDFQASGGRFVARLVPSDPRARAREFADRHPDCEPLERAVVTALALYLDATHPAADSPTAEPASQSEVPPSAAAPAASSSAASASDQAPGDDTQPQEAGGRLTAGLGGGLLVGLGVPAAPAVRAELGYRWSRWHAQATALWLPGTTNEVPPGAVRFELLAGSAELCFQALRTKSLGGELCAGFAAGAQSATARGYGNDSSADQPWFAVPVGLVVDLGQDERRALSEHLRLGLGALIPTDHRTFSVDGLGNVVDPAPVAGWFWLTGALSFAP